MKTKEMLDFLIDRLLDYVDDEKPNKDYNDGLKVAIDEIEKLKRNMKNEVEVFIAMDLEESAKDSIIGIYENMEDSQIGVNEYQSWKVHPSDSIRIITDNLKLTL